MKKFIVILAVLVLALASFACQTLAGGGEGVQEEPPAVEIPGDSQPTEEASDDSDFSYEGDVEFPLPNGATNVVGVAGTVNFQTDLSLEEVMDFYRDVFGKQGYTEREILTVVSDSTFSMAFDGHESGQAIVIQGVDLGDGTVNVNIRLEDV